MVWSQDRLKGWVSFYLLSNKEFSTLITAPFFGFDWFAPSQGFYYLLLAFHHTHKSPTVFCKLILKFFHLEFLRLFLAWIRLISVLLAWSFSLSFVFKELLRVFLTSNIRSDNTLRLQKRIWFVVHSHRWEILNLLTFGGGFLEMLILFTTFFNFSSLPSLYFYLQLDQLWNHLIFTCSPSPQGIFLIFKFLAWVFFDFIHYIINGLADGSTNLIPFDKYMIDGFKSFF